MTRDHFETGRRKRACSNDHEDVENFEVKIKRENEDINEDSSISGIFDSIEFKADDVSFNQLASSESSDMKMLIKVVFNMSQEMKRLTKEVQDIREILEKKLNGTIPITAGKNFQAKYILDLPLKTPEEFNIFDERIKDDEEFRHDFAQSLLVLFDREERLSRTVTNILRRYLSRELAMKFTATKQSATKLVFKDTNFSSCMLDILVQLYEKDSRKIPMSEKKFYQTLSSIFPNAKDWDGCRSLRRRNAAQDFGENYYEDAGE